MQRYLKAIAAAAITGLTAFQVAYQDSILTRQEGITVAIATLVALGGVWAVPNVVRPDAASWDITAKPGGSVSGDE